jgi:polysaccharide export outer membrane protein
VLTGQLIPNDGLPAGVVAIRQGAAHDARVQGRAPSFRAVRLEGRFARLVLSQPSSVTARRRHVCHRHRDVLSVAVYKNADISGEFVVGPDGLITMPLVGSTRAAGLSESELSAELTRKLAETFLVDPQVAVSVKTYSANSCMYRRGHAIGARRDPSGPHDARCPGGREAALTPGTTIELKHATGEITILDAVALDSANVPLPRDGDVLTVQQSNFVSIYGEVRRPNRLTLTPGMTLLQAVALAEGLTDWASKKKVQIPQEGRQRNRGSAGQPQQGRESQHSRPSAPS